MSRLIKIAARSFMKGAGSVFEFRGFLPRPQARPSGDGVTQQDIDMVARDFAVVGNDMRVAMRKFEAETGIRIK